MLAVDIRLPLPGLELAFQGTIDHHATVGLFGPSGSGKTTLLNCVCGLARPASGRITLDDRVLFDSERRIDLPAHRRRIGVVFQDYRLFPHLTALQNICYGAGDMDRTMRRRMAGQLAGLFEMEAVLDRPVTRLSGGERQRVALARAIMARPEVLLLDEPFAALDQGIKTSLLPFLQRLQQETRIPAIVVSHDLDDLFALTDRLVLMRGGRCLGQGSLDELIHQPECLGMLAGQGLTNHLKVRVVDHDPGGGVTHLAPWGAADTQARILITGPLREQAAVGQEVGVSLRSRDVALASGPVAGISMQNQVAGVVTDLIPVDNHYLCRIRTEGFVCLSDIAGPAIIDLNLKVGDTIWCLFKTQALTYRTAGGAGRGCIEPEKTRSITQGYENTLFTTCSV